MKATQIQRDRVATILRNWDGSDAADRASPSTVAEEIDETYREYISALPSKTAKVVAGQKAWSRRVA